MVMMANGKAVSIDLSRLALGAAQVVKGDVTYKDVTMEKTEETMWSAMKRLFINPAIITFLLLNLFMGISWGAADAYLTIYLSEEQSATYAFIGKNILDLYRNILH